MFHSLSFEIVHLATKTMILKWDDSKLSFERI
jgi:hypothetical protein